MASKLLKKGVLCLAFAAAVGLSLNHDLKKQLGQDAPQRDYSVQTGSVDIHAYASAKDAVVYEERNIALDKALAKGSVTKAVHDKEVKADDQEIASLRVQFKDKPALLAEFDQVFLGTLKQKGITPPAKPPQLDPQPNTAPASTPGAPKPSS